MTENLINLGISSCLLGEHVRYDGGHKHDHYLTDTLGTYIHWVPVCPEVECGLPVPREAMRLVGDPEAPRLMTRSSGIDHTGRMQEWAAKKLLDLDKKDLCGFIFKSKSPSSGYKGVKVYSSSGMPGRSGKGIFAGMFIKHFPLIPVEDEGRLHNPMLRENFISRIFVFNRWKNFLRNSRGIKGLISFHTDHKLMIMAHSQKHYAALGRLVAESKKHPMDLLLSEYIHLLMEGLKLAATVKKNTNVLLHIVGYFRNSLSTDEKAELIEVIENYHKGYIPLIVPITLLNHYVRKYNEPYLKAQYYLNPHPAELMLRNHV